jgi:hypothetical protein
VTGAADRYLAGLVPPEVPADCPGDARLVDTADLTLDEIVAEPVARHRRGNDVVRLHSGDPSVFSAVAEQARRLDAEGVPAFAAAAATLGRELILPRVAFGEDDGDGAGELTGERGGGRVGAGGPATAQRSAHGRGLPPGRAADRSTRRVRPIERSVQSPQVPPDVNAVSGHRHLRSPRRRRVPEVGR